MTRSPTNAARNTNQPGFCEIERTAHLYVFQCQEPADTCTKVQVPRSAQETIAVPPTEQFCKIIAVAGERLRRWPQCYENKIRNELATGRIPVFASPFEGAIPGIELRGFRQGTEHSTQGPSRFPKGRRTSRKKRCSPKRAAISTRHCGICELLRGLLQDGSGGLEIVAHRGRRAGLSEIHCSERRTVRASAACSGCGPQLPTRICRGRGRHPHGFGFGPNLLDGSLFPGLGVVRFEPPGRGGEKCPRSASADDRFRAGSTLAR